MRKNAIKKYSSFLIYVTVFEAILPYGEEQNKMKKKRAAYLFYASNKLLLCV